VRPGPGADPPILLQHGSPCLERRAGHRLGERLERRLQVVGCGARRIGQAACQQVGIVEVAGQTIGSPIDPRPLNQRPVRFDLRELLPGGDRGRGDQE
jgi:hypothetical protein